MTIDKIESLDKRKSKVFLDGDFAFVLYKGELRHYHIEEGGELDASVYEEIFYSVICRRVRERALYLLKFSGKTEWEMRRKLKQGLYPEQAVDEAISFLKEYHYLDDDEYARNYVEVYGAGKSRAELLNGLLKKGIDRTLAKEVLSELKTDSREQIASILKKRRFKAEEAAPEEKRKNMAYLMRKGYAYEEIRSVMGAWEQEESGL